MPPRTISIAELRKELRRKERVLQNLLSRRRKVLSRLAKIDRQIVAIGGQVGEMPGGRLGGKAARRGKAPKGRRAKRSRATGTPLAEYIQSVLGKAGGPLRVKDIATAVVKAGYPTHSKSFYGIVAAALRDESRFKRTGRGLYKLAR